MLSNLLALLFLSEKISSVCFVESNLFFVNYFLHETIKKCMRFSLTLASCFHKVFRKISKIIELKQNITSTKKIMTIFRFISTVSETTLIVVQEIECFWECKNLILLKSNQICPNLITFVQISLQFAQI